MLKVTPAGVHFFKIKVTVSTGSLSEQRMLSCGASRCPGLCWALWALGMHFSLAWKNPVGRASLVVEGRAWISCSARREWLQFLSSVVAVDSVLGTSALPLVELLGPDWRQPCLWGN